MSFSVDNPSCDTWKEGGGYEPMKEGAHLMQITRVELTTSQAGNKMLVMRFTDIKDQPGKFCRHAVVLANENWGIGRLVALCKAVHVKGIADDPVDGIDPFDESSSIKALLGKVAVCKVSIGSFTGKNGKEMATNDIDAYKAPRKGTLEELEAENGGEMPPLPDDALKSWDGKRRLGGGPGAVDDDDDDDFDGGDDWDSSDIPF